MARRARAGCRSLSRQAASALLPEEMLRLHCPGFTSSSKPKASGTRSACRLTECSKTASAICSSAPSADRPRTCAGITPASAIGLPLGPKPRRVVAKVEWHPGELYPRVGFIVTNLSRRAERVVAFYNQRGTAEQHIKEGKNAISGPGCRAAGSTTTPSGCSFTRWPTTSVISCAPWRCPLPWNSGH